LRRGVRRQVVASLTIAWINGVIVLRRAPLWIVSYLLMPLALLLFFRIHGDVAMIKMALMGGIIMVATSNGISILGDAAWFRIYVKYQDLLVATPIRPVSYVMGLSLSMLVFASPGLALFVALASLTDLMTLEFALALAACTIAVWISSSMMGFTISTLFKSLRHVWPMASILSMVLSLLPPIYYPATVLPQGLQWVGALAPTGAAAMILHHVAGLVEIEMTALAASIASLIVYATTLLLFSSFKVSWREA